jgi:penicillin-binding protein 1C
VLNLTITGVRGQLLWLLNGRRIATATATEPLKLPITTDGSYHLTATDASGRYTYVEFSARGFGRG